MTIDVDWSERWPVSTPPSSTEPGSCQWERRDARIDEQERDERDAHLAREEPEWIARAEHDRSDLVAPAADRLREDLPFARLPVAADRQDPSGERLRPVRLLGDLQPQLAERRAVPEVVDELEGVTEMRVGLRQRARDREPVEGEPCLDPHRDADEEQEIREVAEQIESCRRRDDEQRQP